MLGDSILGEGCSPKFPTQAAVHHTMKLCTLNPFVVQTLADMLRMGQAPEQLLEYSDVASCRNANEPAARDLEQLSAKIKFLIVIGETFDVQHSSKQSCLL